ncbi:MAG: hypothetical protein ABR976_04355 [Terracidiphilus sp.]
MRPTRATRTARPACCVPAGHIPAGQIVDAPPLLRYWHLASLDAPTVAAAWTLAFAWAASVPLPAWVPILLALAAWAVYIGDRLLDAHSGLRTAQCSNLRLRHRFHWRHRLFFIPAAVAAACAAAFIVFSQMPVAAREKNSLLAAAALVYFTGVHSRREGSSLTAVRRATFVSKEMLVGLLFTAACALPALSRAASQPSSPLWPLSIETIFFALLAWLNCHAIEHWESRGRSRSTVWRPALALALIGFLVSAILSTSHARPAALLLAGAISAFLLLLLDRQRSRLTPLALRVTADLVLLTPIPLFLFAR